MWIVSSISSGIVCKVCSRGSYEVIVIAIIVKPVLVKIFWEVFKHYFSVLCDENFKAIPAVFLTTFNTRN